MTKIEKFQELYRSTLAAKVAYELGKNDLFKAGQACAYERDAITFKMHSERPDLVTKIKNAYDVGESMKNEMMLAGRWPKNIDQKATTYLDVLLNIPVDQRSPELVRCLYAWMDFEEALKEIEKLYPPPEHFHWNGCMLRGPNLYQDFGVSGA